MQSKSAQEVQVFGLHHVTSMGKSPTDIDDLFTKVLGLRRIKKTVNFDDPYVYHLYYATGIGAPGTVMTYFPFPNIAPKTSGSREVGETCYSVPPASLEYWRERLLKFDIRCQEIVTQFEERRLRFLNKEDEGFALVEVPEDRRPQWGNDIPEESAIRGFHSVVLNLTEAETSAEILQVLGYECLHSKGQNHRFAVKNSNGSSFVDLAISSNRQATRAGAGSVHHIAFAAKNDDELLSLREKLMAIGQNVTPIIDRDYFHSIYFRTPSGILFEVATNGPGFLIDEEADELGQKLQLPKRHEHLRERLLQELPAL